MICAKHDASSFSTDPCPACASEAARAAPDFQHFIGDGCPEHEESPPEAEMREFMAAFVKQGAPVHVTRPSPVASNVGDLGTLEALAMGATPGPWENEPGDKLPVAVKCADGYLLYGPYVDYQIDDPAEIDAMNEANVAYICACSPDRILALVGELKQALELEVKLRTMASKWDKSEAVNSSSFAYELLAVLGAK